MKHIIIMIMMLPLIGITQEAKKLEELRAKFVTGVQKRAQVKNKKIEEANEEYRKSMVAWTKGYIKALEKEKVKETKAGRLEPAMAYLAEIDKMKKLLEKPEAIVVKKPKPVVVPKTPMFPAKPSIKYGAKVAVEHTKWLTLKKGLPVYNYTKKLLWTDMSKELEGKKITQLVSGNTGIALIEVLRTGTVVIATNPTWGNPGLSGGTWLKELITEKELAAAGWKKHESWFLVSTYNKNREEKYSVWTRQCKAGEKFSIRTTKYATPIVIDMR